MRSLRQLWVVAVILAGMFGGRVDATLALRRALFSSGEAGWIYNPNKLSTLFQDAAMTTPVTAVDQPVGAMLDLSGNGKHATQVTSTARPVLKQDAFGRYYIQADGVDDFMLFPQLDVAAGAGRLVAARVKYNQGSTRVMYGMAANASGYLGQVSGVHHWRDCGLLGSATAGGTLASVAGYLNASSGGFIVNGAETAATGSGNGNSYRTLFANNSGVSTASGADFYGGVLRLTASTQQQALNVADWLDEAQ